MAEVRVMDHPLIQHKITYIRQEGSGQPSFVRLSVKLPV